MALSRRTWVTPDIVSCASAVLGSLNMEKTLARRYFCTMSNVHNVIDSEFEGTDDKDMRWDMAGERKARRVRKRERDQAGRGKGKRGEVAESKGRRRWKRSKKSRGGRGGEG